MAATKEKTLGLAEDQVAHYYNIFRELLDSAFTSDPDWVKALRTEGITQFRDLGIPTIKQEEWRFTNVAPLARIPFRPPDQTSGLSLEERGLQTFLAEKRECQIVFVNGLFSRELTSLSNLPDGVLVSSLAESFQDDRVRYHLGRYVSIQENAFAALNTALMRDGAYVYIPDRVEVDTPIELLYISNSKDEHPVYFPRNLIVVGKRSVVTVVENYVSATTARHFANPVTEVRVGDEARIDHCKIQQENPHSYHIATSQIMQDRGSNYYSTSFSNGAGIARNDLNSVLDGEGAFCSLNGLYLASGHQHVDNHTTIDHSKRHCTSQEFYKGVLAGRSRGIFNGRIIVRKEAQLTDARQTNKNLLITDGAQVNTKPQLQIEADDVKCTHGATIGQLDPLAIFYLNSRGIDREAAQSLLMFGFANEITAGVKDESLRERLSRKIQQALDAVPFQSPAVPEIPSASEMGEANR